MSAASCALTHGTPAELVPVRPSLARSLARVRAQRALVVVHRLTVGLGGGLGLGVQRGRHELVHLVRLVAHP